MISERTYKRGRSVADAVAELQRCSGTQFDGELVAAFLTTLDNSTPARLV
jgi:HD-GYP domain-containing protein (c-di-GMP phosphodiesterase class II)